jgi:hypothetical protein
MGKVSFFNIILAALQLLHFQRAMHCSLPVVFPSQCMHNFNFKNQTISLCFKDTCSFQQFMLLNLFPALRRTGWGHLRHGYASVKSDCHSSSFSYMFCNFCPAL